MRRWWVLVVVSAAALGFASVAWACVPGGQESAPTTAAEPSAEVPNADASQYGGSAETPSDEGGPSGARAVGVAFVAAGVAAVVFGVTRVRGRRVASPSAPLSR